MEEIGTAEGFEKATKTILNFLNNTTDGLLICADQYWPSVAMGIDVFRNTMLDLSKRKIPCRFITEITADNLQYCKDLMKMSEVRHLAGLKGNFAANQTQYIASATMRNLELLPQVIYSNSTAVVEQHHFFFENLWNNATPAEQRIIEIEEGIAPAETKIIHGKENVSKVISEFLLNGKRTYDVCCDKNGPSVIIETPQFNEIYSAMGQKEVSIRIITEITADNLKHCKQIMERFGAQIKHLEGIKGNFGITDNKIYAATSNLEGNRPISQLIYSNTKGIVEQNQYLFETLWKKATPAEQRIIEIEEGLAPVETIVIDDYKEIFNHIVGIAEKTKIGLSNCSSIGGLQLIYDNDYFFRSYINLLERNRDEKASGGIRWVTHLEDKAEQINLIRKFLHIGVQIRHVKNLPPLHFSLSESQFQATIEKMEGGTMFQRILYSTEPLYIKHFQLLFEELWKIGIDAEQRIGQIENGTASETTVVVENSMEIKKLFLQMIQEARGEIMIVFPSFNAVKRQHMIGVIDAFRQKIKDDVKIRILSPINEGVRKILRKEIESLTLNNILIREITKQQDIKSTILMVDKKYLLAIELKDDSAETFDKAIGLATYSTSKPTILSNISIFESLWTQTELYDRLRIANQKLEVHSKMQNDFINIAAHELRTPTQAISGNLELIEMAYVPSLFEYSSNRANSIDLEFENLVKDKNKMHEFMESLASTYRNSQRLEKLVKDILDVSRIESNRLEIHREHFNLNEKIRNVLKDIHSKTKSNFQVKKPDNQQPDIAFETFNDPIVVFADKIRIFEAISNLISNAIKFSEGEPIKISVNRIQENDIGQKLDVTNNDGPVNTTKTTADDEGMVIVSIRDSGKGIDNEILPRLFTKFATKSDKGTGLGLYIAKNIVEAHGGQIWAQNNKDGKGATFSFSLPIDKKNSIINQ